MAKLEHNLAYLIIVICVKGINVNPCNLFSDFIKLE